MRCLHRPERSAFFPCKYIIECAVHRRQYEPCAVVGALLNTSQCAGFIIMVTVLSLLLPFCG